MVWNQIIMKNVKIAITGGIGSGKTTLINLIKNMGFPVYSCDEICQKLYKKRRFLKKLKILFPTGVKGKIILKAQKQEIAREVFNDQEKNHYRRRM